MTPIQSAILNASKELELPLELVQKVYRAYWLAIKQYIQALPLKENLDKENFCKLTTSINVPSLGKLYTTYDKIQGVRKRFEYLQKIRNV